MSAFPPLHSRPSQYISSDQALSHLQAYLAAAETTPHLLPNSVLSPSGPTASDASSNLTIHNLKRVEAGLRGEWLAPVLDLESGVGGVSDQSEGMSKAHQDDWQDLEDYQKAQSDIEGEIGARMPTAHNSSNDSGAVPMEVDANEGVRLSKEERKAAKKARSKEERKQKQKEQQR